MSLSVFLIGMQPCIVSFRGGTVGLYRHKETWKPSTCDFCECNDGASQCTAIICNVPGCGRYSQPLRGECCGKCLEYDPVAVNRGNVFICCDHQMYKTVRDENSFFYCLLIYFLFEFCHRSLVCLVYPGACIVETGDPEKPQVIHKAGEKWQPNSLDPCTSCQCINGSAACLAALCFKDANCLKYDDASDVCCPPCKVHNSGDYIVKFILHGVTHCIDCM